MRQGDRVMLHVKHLGSGVAPLAEDEMLRLRLQHDTIVVRSLVVRAGQP